MVSRHSSFGAFRLPRASLVGCLCTLAFLLSSCEGPQTPAPVVQPDYLGNFDASSGAMELRLQAPNGDLSPLRLVVSQIVVDAANHQVHASVAVRNVGSAVVAGPNGIEVSDFVPDDVVPANAACRVCVQEPCPTRCVFDHRGTYGDDATLAPGETSTPVEWIFDNPSDESFAFRARVGDEFVPDDGRISGYVFRDLNANGHRDDGEPGLEGAILSLEGEQVSAQAGSGPDGRYQFQVTEPGLYELIFGCPPCGIPPYPCQLTTPGHRQVLVVQRPDGSLSSFDRGDFGCAGPPEPTHVAGVVFEDRNRDGQRDLGEPGIAGVRIISASLQCDIAPVETRTDERGQYVIPLVGCRPWSISHEGPSGYLDTTPNPVILPRERRTAAGDSLPTPPIPFPPLYRVDFGVTRDDTPLPPFRIVGVVFHDANRNGLREPDEAGLPHVGVSASGLLCASPSAAYTTTDEEGRYALRGADIHCFLPWGVWAAPERPFDSTTPNPVELHMPPPDGMVFQVDFGFAPRDTIPPDGARVFGTVFHDLNGDGVYDRGEPGLPDVELQLGTVNPVIIATRTYRFGRYAFDRHVSPFEVRQTVPDFQIRTTPNPVPIDHAPGDTEHEVNFGVRLQR